MSIIVLDTINDSITALMSGAPATTNPAFTAHYADATSSVFTEGKNDGTFNGVTPVTIVGSPAASTRRIVREIIIHNSDTASVTITISYVSAGGTRKQFTFTLAVGGTWKLSQSEAAIAAASTTVAGAVELATRAEVTTRTSTTLVPSVDSLNGIVYEKGGTLIDPQSAYTKRAQVVIDPKTRAALTISAVYTKLNDNTPTAEFAGDLKFADEQFDGSFANATLICAVDTTSGSSEVTGGFNDATVPAGKVIYLQMDASPHADIDNISIKYLYTLD